MKKAFLVLMVIVMAGIITCFPIESASQSKDTKVIAIATLMSHPILDTVQQNLLEELKEAGFVDGKNVKIILRNANGQIPLVASIANDLASQNPDIIVSITTPMSQAVKKVARGPMIFGAVTDPVGAGLVSSLEKGEELITGTSDALPYDDQLRLIQKITPNVKRLGVLYNPGEAASQYGIKQIRKFAPALGFSLVEGAVSSTGEVYSVAQNLVDRVDAMLLSTDNTVAAGVAGAVKVAVEHKRPLYAFDNGSIEKGALAAVSAGYAQIGRDTGRLVVRVLNGERGIPTIVAKGSEVYVNKKAAELMGVTVPEGILQSATKVYTEIKE